MIGKKFSIYDSKKKISGANLVYDSKIKSVGQI